jgi:hypothetical protein
MSNILTPRLEHPWFQDVRCISSKTEYISHLVSSLFKTMSGFTHPNWKQSFPCGTEGDSWVKVFPGLKSSCHHHLGNRVMQKHVGVCHQISLHFWAFSHGGRWSLIIRRPKAYTCGLSGSILFNRPSFWTFMISRC